MRLIDADALIGKTFLNPLHAPYIMDADVKTAPTIDAVPVVHGRWIKLETSEAYDIAGVKTWALRARCSICGMVHQFIEAHMAYGYCPHCGAKMNY